MKRVKWKTKHEYEYISNLKLLQQGFRKKNITKWIDVRNVIVSVITVSKVLKLSKAKY